MKIKSALVTQASGSIGGLTASRNRGGMYLRARSIPLDPGTPFQQFIKATVADLSNQWVNVLTSVQRDSWNEYALNVPLPDTLGELRNIGGLAHFVRSHVPRRQTPAAALPDVLTGPGVFDTGEFTPFSAPVVDASADTLTITFDDTDACANEEDAGACILCSRPQNPSINYFKGPYRFAATVLGAALPPTEPAVVTLPFPVAAAGQVVFIQVRVTRADGRLSYAQRLRAVAVA